MLKTTYAAICRANPRPIFITNTSDNPRVQLSRNGGTTDNDVTTPTWDAVIATSAREYEIMVAKQEYEKDTFSFFEDFIVQPSESKILSLDTSNMSACQVPDNITEEQYREAAKSESTSVAEIKLRWAVARDNNQTFTNVRPIRNELTNKFLEIDIFIGNNCGIEVDGRQHLTDNCQIRKDSLKYAIANSDNYNIYSVGLHLAIGISQDIMNKRPESPISIVHEAFEPGVTQ